MLWDEKAVDSLTKDCYNSIEISLKTSQCRNMGVYIMEKPVEALLRGGQFKRLMEREMSNVRKQYQLKRIEIEVLYFLSKCGEYNTLLDIARYLNANKGHISQTVDSLSQKGYITVHRDENDRRYVHYGLTEGAMPMIESINTAWAKLTRELFEGITPEEMEALKQISKKLRQNMEKILNM